MYKRQHLASDKENLDTGTPTGKLMLTMIAAINEFERQNMLDRQQEDVYKRQGYDYPSRNAATIADLY